MSRSSRRPDRPAVDGEILAGKRRKSPPYEFVLDALAALAPTTRPMFGCVAVYIEEKIVMILRDRGDWPEDNGVWLATAAEHHASLLREFPRMRSIRLLGRQTTHWQVLPADAPDFEETVLRACELVHARDPRIGKIPKSRRIGKFRKAKHRSPRRKAR